MPRGPRQGGRGVEECRVTAGRTRPRRQRSSGRGAVREGRLLRLVGLRLFLCLFLCGASPFAGSALGFGSGSRDPCWRRRDDVCTTGGLATTGGGGGSRRNSAGGGNGAAGGFAAAGAGGGRGSAGGGNGAAGEADQQQVADARGSRRNSAGGGDGAAGGLTAAGAGGGGSRRNSAGGGDGATGGLFTTGGGGCASRRNSAGAGAGAGGRTAGGGCGTGRISVALGGCGVWHGRRGRRRATRTHPGRRSWRRGRRREPRTAAGRVAAARRLLSGRTSLNRRGPVATRTCGRRRCRCPCGPATAGQGLRRGGRCGRGGQVQHPTARACSAMFHVAPVATVGAGGGVAGAAR